MSLVCPYGGTLLNFAETSHETLFRPTLCPHERGIFMNLDRDSSCDILLKKHVTTYWCYAPSVTLPLHCPLRDTFLNFAVRPLMWYIVESPVTTYSYYAAPVLIPTLRHSKDQVLDSFGSRLLLLLFYYFKKILQCYMVPYAAITHFEISYYKITYSPTKLLHS